MVTPGLAGHRPRKPEGAKASGFDSYTIRLESNLCGGVERRLLPGGTGKLVCGSSPLLSVVDQVSMRKLYAYYEGGLGDVILCQRVHHRLAGLAEYKKTHDCYVRIVLNVHNFQAAELFRYQLNVDEVQVVSFDPALKRQIQEDLALEGFDETEVLPNKTEVVDFTVSAGDHQYLDRVLPVEPFLMLHGGAGKKHYNLFNVTDFRPLFDRAEKAGLKVVTVGGSSFRTMDGLLPETFRGSHPALVNLIGLANPRLVFEIARRAKAFVGSLSCHVWAAAHHAKPGLCIAPDGLDDWYTAHVGEVGMTLGRMSELASASVYDSLFDK